MPRCKHCKEKFDPIHFNQKFCFKDECKAVWIETEKEKQWRQRKRQMKEDSETVQDLIKKAQKVFNEYIRLRDKDKPCVSCGRKLRGKYDAGHFYSAGGHFNVRFDERNVHAQCVHCNQHLHGNIHNYLEGIKERIGQREFISLREISQLTRDFTREELRQLITDYRKKIKDFKNNQK